jgi:hypothetical protein
VRVDNEQLVRKEQQLRLAKEKRESQNSRQEAKAEKQEEKEIEVFLEALQAL